MLNEQQTGEIRLIMMGYLVCFKPSEYEIDFECYEADEIDGERLSKLRGSFCWRGVWEGRLYFTDDEYFGEEISELSDLYNNHIVKWCKDFIKKRDSRNYDD